MCMFSVYSCFRYDHCLDTNGCAVEKNDDPWQPGPSNFDVDICRSVHGGHGEKKRASLTACALCTSAMPGTA